MKLAIPPYKQPHGSLERSSSQRLFFGASNEQRETPKGIIKGIQFSKFVMQTETYYATG